MITQHELLDIAIQQVGNRYLATMLIAKRIRQLYHGAPERLSRQEGESNFSIAIREIAAGLVAMNASSDIVIAGANVIDNEPPTAANDTLQE
ncbi:DNA-directed RNA polymerase subunit omega [Candidatus Entotheonellaceae bacterium PAL068K]